MSIGVHPHPETALAEDRPYRMSVDQYVAIAEAGILPKEARTYLNDGVLVEKIEEPEDDPPYLISTDQYWAMVEAGIFPEHARIYLRDGRIVEKMAKTNAHCIVSAMFHEVLHGQLPVGWKVFLEGQFTLDEGNVVLPDVAVVRGQSFRSLLPPGQFPSASKLGLVVEIAVTSLGKDLGPNLRRYAQARIPSYWVVDVAGARILVHSQPGTMDGQHGYAQVLTAKAGDTIPLILDDQEIAQLSYDTLMP